jgi:hypothetical protein
MAKRKNNPRLSAKDLIAIADDLGVQARQRSRRSSAAPDCG